MKPWIKILLEVLGTLLWYLLLIWSALIVVENSNRNATFVACCAAVLLVVTGFLYVFYDVFGRLPRWDDLNELWLRMTMLRPKNIGALIVVITIVVLAAVTCPDKQKHVEAHMDTVETTSTLGYLLQEAQLNEDLSIRNNILFSVAESKRFERIVSVGIFGLVIVLNEYSWTEDPIDEILFGK